MANNTNEVGYVHLSGTVTQVPSATSTQIIRCGDLTCDHIHIFLMDQADQPFAEVTLSNDFVKKLIAISDFLNLTIL